MTDSLELELVSDDDGVEESQTRYEGYADYSQISLSVAKSIERAVDAYSRIDSMHQEGASVPPEVAAEARGRIKSAAMKLVPEMRSDRDVDGTPYNEILTRWETRPGDDEPGYLASLDDVHLSDTCPGWLFDFVLDIRTAGWELGYLRAGRERQTKSSRDPVEQESDDMLQE